MKVIEQCAPKVESDIKQFLISSVSGDSRFSSSQIDYHEVIYDLYRCAPQTLSGIAPYLTGELLVHCYSALLPLFGYQTHHDLNHASVFLLLCITFE